MKKNGFTLVELLITIAIIAILGVISVSSIINSLGGAKNDLDEYQKDILINTAKLYFDDNVDTSDAVDGKTYNICIQGSLVANNYLEDYKDDSDNDIYGVIVLTTKVSDGIITKIESDISIGFETDCK